MPSGVQVGDCLSMPLTASLTLPPRAHTYLTLLPHSSIPPSLPTGNPGRKNYFKIDTFRIYRNHWYCQY